MHMESKTTLKILLKFNLCINISKKEMYKMLHLLIVSRFANSCRPILTFRREIKETYIQRIFKKKTSFCRRYLIDMHFLLQAVWVLGGRLEPQRKESGDRFFCLCWMWGFRRIEGNFYSYFSSRGCRGDENRTRFPLSGINGAES